MADCAKSLLETARKSRNLSRLQMADALGESVDTIYRWENDSNKNAKCVPDPDTVDRIAEILRTPSLWHRWMCAEYESYRKRHVECGQFGLIASVMRVRHDLDDLVKLQDRVELDVIDGKFDDPYLKETFIREAREAMESLRQVVEELAA